MSNETPSLSEALHMLIRDNKRTDITVGDFLEAVGDKSFGLLLMLLALPSALPVPAAGYSTPFGILIIILGVQMLCGKKTPWLPRKSLNMKIKKSFAKKMVAGAEWFLSKAERFIKPRLTFVSNRAGQVFLGLQVIIMAALMILPIPLTNTAPAMVIFLIGTAISEDDGLLGILCMGVSSLAVALYACVLYIFFHYGKEGVLELKDSIKHWVLSD